MVDFIIHTQEHTEKHRPANSFLFLSNTCIYEDNDKHLRVGINGTTNFSS